MTTACWLVFTVQRRSTPDSSPHLSKGSGVENPREKGSLPTSRLPFVMLAAINFFSAVRYRSCGTNCQHFVEKRGQVIRSAKWRSVGPEKAAAQDGCGDP